MEGESTDLERSVLRTAVWFSLFSYPLTAFELWKWLMLPGRLYGLGEVCAVLEKSRWLEGKMFKQDGFYALGGSVPIAGLVKERHARFLDAERKFRALRRAVRFFSLLPCVRAVGAVNTMAWWSTAPRSDIDLYVITRPGRIWSSRFWLVLPFLLSGRRPAGSGSEGSVQDPFCFSFFSAHDALQLESLCLPRDYYMSFWVKSIVPVLDRDGWFAQLEATNRWSSKVLPNVRLRTMHHRHCLARLPALVLQPAFLEPMLRRLQQRRLPASLRELANVDTRVVMNDRTLKFHEGDRRAEFRDRFEALFASCV